MLYIISKLLNTINTIKNYILNTIKYYILNIIY